MKMAIVILLSLAVTSIIGTVIPQNKNPTEYLQAFGEFLYRLFDVFDFFDMYGSWWFQLLIILLTINCFFAIDFDSIGNSGGDKFNRM